MTVTAPLAATVGKPIPAGRGRWRIVAYTRQWSAGALPTPIAELTNARGRRLSRKLNSPAELTFTLDGHDPTAALLVELATDVVAWRWEEGGNRPGVAGGDCVMFRGVIDHSEDQLSQQSAVVTFTCHDYLAMLARRITTSTLTYTQVDQDQLAALLLSWAINARSSSGTLFTPGSWLPLSINLATPQGGQRGSQSGVLRDRTWQSQTVIGNALDDLANVQGGFDYDVLPRGPAGGYDYLRLWYPQQGYDRTDVALVYGANVAALTRTVASGDYANYVRTLGNNGSADPAAAQLYGEAWNTDANNITVNPVGLWMAGENAADVVIAQTLVDKANGDLAWSGLLTPAYTLTLTPGAWTQASTTPYRGYPDIGDSVPLVVTEGRLAVNTNVRVVGIDFDIGDDGQEDVHLTVGRPPTTLARILTRGDRDIDALARR